MIAVIDYGAGNLRSISRGLLSHTPDVEITNDLERIAAADRLVLPGVGNAKAAMERLQRQGIAETVIDRAEDGVPVLGICLGMQLMLGEQEEGPTFGLNIIPGKVKLLPPSHKVPHMGWNRVSFAGSSPLSSLQDANYYFVHSYFAEPKDRSDIAGVTAYGVEFPSILIRGNVWGMQFHPEKSGEAGLNLLKTWLDFTP